MRIIFLKQHSFQNAGYQDYTIASGYNGYQVEEPAPKKEDKKNQQDFSKIPGIPGHDYPIYHAVPETSFSCKHVPALPGMYANVETGCQVSEYFILIRGKL